MYSGYFIQECQVTVFILYTFW